jgi:hypothetical protein
MLLGCCHCGEEPPSESESVPPSESESDVSSSESSESVSDDSNEEFSICPACDPGNTIYPSAWTIEWDLENNCPFPDMFAGDTRLGGCRNDYLTKLVAASWRSRYSALGLTLFASGNYLAGITPLYECVYPSFDRALQAHNCVPGGTIYPQFSLHICKFNGGVLPGVHWGRFVRVEWVNTVADDNLTGFESGLLYGEFLENQVDCWQSFHEIPFLFASESFEVAGGINIGPGCNYTLSVVDDPGTFPPFIRINPYLGP